MNPNKKKEIMRKYDSTAHIYDNRYSKIQNQKLNLIFKEFYFKNKYLLDAGCGTGLFYDYYVEHMLIDSKNRFRLLSVDISWNMLKAYLLKLRTKEKSIKNQVNLILSDLENLPFRENIFHALLSLTSLQNLPNILNGIKELFRVTRNNGEVKFSILKKKIELDNILSYIKLQSKNLELIENDELEDVILDFILRKKR